MRRTGDLEAKKVAAAEAVNSATHDNKVQVAREAVEQLSFQQQNEVANRFLPSRGVADNTWIMIVRAFTIVLVISMLALVGVVALSVFREVDKGLVQIMLTVFFTVAGILAGFITGQAVGATGTTEDLIWSQIVKTFRWLMWSVTIALVAAIGVALFREVDGVLVQILLTLVTTAAGILVGLVAGHAFGASERKRQD